MTKSKMTRLRAARPHLCAAAVGRLLLAALAGCDAGVTEPTEVTVTVTGHAELVPSIQRVRASVYESDSRDGGAPVQTHDFVLGGGLDAGAQAKLPFSFGITPGRATRFLLVVEGFGSLDPAEAPLVELKQIGAFTSDRSLVMPVFLSASCANMYTACTGLTQTCWPEARACGPLREASMARAAAANLGIDAGPLPSRNPPECPPDACSPNYPCTPTPPQGYVCLGQSADYPMPYFGSGHPPAFDLSEPGVAVDRVTGLAWQREQPQRYEGCTLTLEAVGDLCTQDEAKRYCGQLRLGGRSWRLPSRPELDSLLDLHVDEEPLLDHEAFPGTPPAGRSYWTASTMPLELPGVGYYASISNFSDGVMFATNAFSPEAVRCVSGVPRGRGTPEQRLRVDPPTDTVHDQASTLTWQRAPSTVATSHAQAHAACAALGAGWRLPNPKELLGILDFSRLDPMLPAVFPKPPRSQSWSEVLRRNGGVMPLLVEHKYYGALAAGEEENARGAVVRCVR